MVKKNSSKPTPHTELEKKICLCMIVKNESRIIERCLNSAKSMIDFVSICDTGSIDQTPEIIGNWCKKNSVAFTVHHKSFENFGYNRTLAANLAKETYPQADYLLLLDADMILTVNPLFKKSSLNKNQYLIMQYNKYIKYWNTRLIKTSLPWRCVGVTHEYWDIDRSMIGSEQCPDIETKGKLDSLVINDQEDGGSKSDKFERDKRLLLEGIDNPTTPSNLMIRYLFYLAQTFFCLHEFEESIKWYKKRVKAGGWEEEVFYSLLQIGICYERLAGISSFKLKQLVKEGDENKSMVDQSTIDNLAQQEEQYFSLATTYFQESWEYRPTRAEPLYHLARIYRINSKHNISLMYAIQGKEVPFPKDDVLFLDYHVYDYLLDYEISICAYYIESKRDLGRSALNRLQSKIEQLPQDIAGSVESNAKFY
ncbi:glycosyltransferase [Priestia megaterium]